MLLLLAEDLKAIQSKCKRKKKKASPEEPVSGSPEGASGLNLSACKDVPSLASGVENISPKIFSTESTCMQQPDTHTYCRHTAPSQHFHLVIFRTLNQSALEGRWHSPFKSKYLSLQCIRLKAADFVFMH